MTYEIYKKEELKKPTETRKKEDDVGIDMNKLVEGLSDKEKAKVVAFIDVIEQEKKDIFSINKSESWSEYFSSWVPGWSAFSSMGACISNYFIEPAKNYVIYPLYEKLSGIIDTIWEKTPWKWLFGLPMTALAVIIFWGPATKSGEEIAKWLNLGTDYVEPFKIFVGIINLLSRGALNLNALFPFLSELYQGLAAVVQSVKSCDLEILRNNFFSHFIFFLGLTGSSVASIFPIFPWTWFNLSRSEGWETLLYALSTISRLAVYSMPISAMVSVLWHVLKKDGLFAQYRMSRDQYLEHLCKMLDEETLAKILTELGLSGMALESMSEEAKEKLFKEIEKEYSWGKWASTLTNWLKLFMEVSTQLIAFISALGGHLSFMNLAEVEYLQYLFSVFVIFSAPLFMKSMNEFMNITHNGLSEIWNDFMNIIYTIYKGLSEIKNGKIGSNIFHGIFFAIYNGLSEIWNGKIGSNILHGLFFIFSLTLGVMTSFSYRTVVMANVEKSKIEWMQSPAMKWIWNITAILGSVAIHSKAVYNLLVKITNAELLKKLGSCISNLFSCMQKEASKENSATLDKEMTEFKKLLEKLDSIILDELKNSNEETNQDQKGKSKLEEFVDEFLKEYKPEKQVNNRGEQAFDEIFDDLMQQFSIEFLKNGSEKTKAMVEQILEQSNAVVNEIKQLIDIKGTLTLEKKIEDFEKIKLGEDKLKDIKQKLQAAKQILQCFDTLTEGDSVNKELIEKIEKAYAKIETLERIISEKNTYVKQLDTLKKLLANFENKEEIASNENKIALINSTIRLVKVFNTHASRNNGGSKYEAEVDKLLHDVYTELKGQANKVDVLKSRVDQLCIKITDSNTLKQLQTSNFKVKVEEKKPSEEPNESDELVITIKESQEDKQKPNGCGFFSAENNDSEKKRLLVNTSQQANEPVYNENNEKSCWEWIKHCCCVAPTYMF